MSSQRTEVHEAGRASTGLRASKEIAKRVQNGVYYVWRVLPGLRNIALARLNRAATPLSHRTESNQRKKDVSKLPSLTFEPSLHPIDIAPDVRLLPPPPPPPPMFSIPTSGNEPHDLYHASPAKSTHKLDEMETSFEELQDVKQDLTGSRFRLQRDRKEVQNIREKTGTKEGYALNQLRGFLEEEGITLPRAIQENFEQTHALRDQLGLREAEYDDAEHQYNDLEVKFIQKLSKFVDDLLDDLPQSLPAGRPDVLASQANGAANFAFDVQDDWMVLDPTPEYTDGDPVTRASMTTDTSIAASEISTLLANPATSDTSGQRQAAPAQDKTEEQGLPESEKRTWLLAQTKINPWLLDMISMSPLQKAHLPIRPRSNELYEASWWEGSGKHWYLISSTGAQFYVNNSTALNNDASDCCIVPELDSLHYDSINEQTPLSETLCPVRSMLEKEQDIGSLLYPRTVPLQASEPIGDVFPKQRHSQTGATDFWTTRSLSSNWKSPSRYATRRTTRTSTTLPYLGSHIGHYEYARQRRHTTGVDAPAVYQEDSEGVETPSQDLHVRHYSDKPFPTDRHSITRMEEASLSVITEPFPRKDLHDHTRLSQMKDFSDRGYQIDRGLTTERPPFHRQLRT